MCDIEIPTKLCKYSWVLNITGVPNTKAGGNFFLEVNN